MWHYTFQQETDIPEALVADRERIYLKHFYDRLCVNPARITPHNLDHYDTSFANQGAWGVDLSCIVLPSGCEG